MSPAWWQLHLRVPGQELEAVEDGLLAAGAETVSWLEDDAASPVFVDGETWAINQGEALFAGTEEGRAAIDGLLAQPHWQSYQPRVEALAEQDWVAQTQAAFPAQQFGRLWVAPRWAEAPAEALLLRLDPGRAFGTGSHATTALCLEFLSETIAGGETVLDYGCGSGILAIAALLLGAESAVGVDTDPVALEVAGENAQENAVAERMKLCLPDAEKLGQYPIVVANILAAPLIDLAPLLAQRVLPGGRVALSGLLHAQEDLVRAAYAPYFSLAPSKRRSDWSLIVGERLPGERDGSPMPAL
ncbi:50S ribosomal protein L11 methyltransferase [Acidithiobacillus sp. IBUN Pt1247-S3]|uniref:50S ribosomal protein L11 methyltransferase n=1 Tax=Acidithiobacillus sp. IBUN Pt1247-S3 TaxID=3166642 RepID=UPI0034E4888A